MANDAAYADRVRRRAREAKRRLRAQNREKHNRQRRESYYRLRNDPDRWAEFLAKKRAYWQHLKKNDREKYEAALEARRITNRLRRIENGLPVWEPKRFKENEKATVSALPLRPLIDQWERTFRLERAKDGIEVPAIRTLAERAGVSDRLIYRIRNEHDRVSLDAADKLCHAIGVHFGFVYMDEESEGNDE